MGSRRPAFRWATPTLELSGGPVRSTGGHVASLASVYRIRPNAMRSATSPRWAAAAVAETSGPP